MIEILNTQTLDGKRIDKKIASSKAQLIDASGLTLLPALIDPHVHFRTPGLEYKENWISAAAAAVSGGITRVFDMPNTKPSTTTLARVLEKKKLIDAQLQEIGIPLRYHLFLGADKNHFAEIERAKEHVIGIKVFMGSSTGELLMDDEESLHRAFSLASQHNLPLAIHAEDEELIQQRKKLFKGATDPATHSELRSPEVAIRATARAIELAKQYGTRLYLLHIGTKEEVQLIAQAKKEGLSLFAEACPHHLFLNEEIYATLGTKAQMNPPLRTREDNESLWKAIHDGTIDTIGSDHAPHTLAEKTKPYGEAPSGMPGVETTLPLLLDAHNKGRLSLSKIVELMHDHILQIFNLPREDDWILVDLEKVKKVDEKMLKTRAGWSPYAGWELKGWPVYTILQGKVFANEY